MNSVWYDLDIILQQEIWLYQKLLELAILQKEAISEKNVERIQEITNEKNTVVLKLKIVADTREKIVKCISSQYNVNTTILTLSQLVKLADEPYVTRFKKYYEILQKLVRELQRINTANYIFFRHSLQYVQNAIQILMNNNGKNEKYNRTGIYNFDCSPGYIDQKL